MNDQSQPVQLLQVERVKLVDLGDYLRRRNLELSEVALDCRRSAMYVTAQTRPRGQGGAVRVNQIG